MLALLVLAQVAAASPSTTPVPALGTTTVSVPAGPKTLADVARERKLGRKGVAGTFSVAGATGMPEVPAVAGATGRRDVRDAHDAHDAQARVRNAQADVQAARRALDDVATRSGMTSENAAATRRTLIEAQRELGKAREDAARHGR